MKTKPDYRFYLIYFGSILVIAGAAWLVLQHTLIPWVAWAAEVIARGTR